MYVTVLPLSSKTYPCAPKANETSPLMVAKRVVKLMSGFGLAVNGKQVYCGDFIYSGHTVILVLSYLIMSECKYTLLFVQYRRILFFYSFRLKNDFSLIIKF